MLLLRKREIILTEWKQENTADSAGNTQYTKKLNSINSVERCYLHFLKNLDDLTAANI